MLKMCGFLHGNRDSPTLILLNVHGVMGVLKMLNVLNVLNIPMDASLACWALLNQKWHWSQNQNIIKRHTQILGHTDKPYSRP